MTEKQEKLTQNLDRVNMWIGNCDQKASFLLTMLGVVITVICTSDFACMIKDVLVSPFVAYWRDDIGGFNLFRSFIALFMIAGLGFLLASIMLSLLSLIAKTDYEKEKQECMADKSRIHFGGIAKMTYADFVQSEGYDYDNDLNSQVYVNSKICDDKFRKYKSALKLTFVAVPLLVITFVLLLFT
jgi:hypothetical protein